MSPVASYSRSPHGERGLKSQVRVQSDGDLGRSPHGERGLKYAVEQYNHLSGLSLSSWRAWIEILVFLCLLQVVCRRSPHGERGLKFRSGRFRRLRPRVALLMESVD